MNKTIIAIQQQAISKLPLVFRSIQSGILQRKCACGNHTTAGGECADCAKKKKMGLQRKLTIGASNDPLEQEADRIADQVMAVPGHSAVSGTPVKVQCFTGSPSGQTAEAPASVERVLASPGQPLEPSLREEMEGRFGYDFSRVRVHTGSAAEQSARDVSARAYTVGNNIVFGAGQFTPEMNVGWRLIAHELTHVMQQNSATIASNRMLQRRPCTSRDAPDAIIDTHTVTPATGIRAPGDSIQFNIRFNCDIQGLRSDIEDSGGTSLELGMFPAASMFPRDSFSRNWDGRRFFDRVGTYMVDDGNYRHRLSQVHYAYLYNRTTGVSDRVYASGANLFSPNITVSTRTGAFTNFRSNHFNTANVETVARIIRSEMGIGNAAEQRAIAWAVRNQMVRLNTRDAIAAQNHFGDAHGSAPTDDDRHLAQEVLSVDMRNDTGGGAIKWFSPRSMPSEGESCARFDCRGGLITVADPAGINRRKFAPAFHRDMTYVAVTAARDWFVRFYRLS